MTTLALKLTLTPILIAAAAARRFGPVLCLAIGFAVYAVATLVARRLETGPWMSFAIVCTFLAISLLDAARAPATDETEPPRWDMIMSF